MKKLIKLTLILLITILITTGCRVSKTRKLACENKSIELTKTWLNNQGIKDYEIISSTAHVSKSGEIWPDIYLYRNLSGTADVTIKYKGVEKTILAYCDERNNQKALDMMTRYNERSSSIDKEDNCMFYKDIKICSTSKTDIEDLDLKIVEVTINDPKYNQVMDAYSITSSKKGQFYRVFIPIDKIQVEYNSLSFLDIQIRENENYPTTRPLTITNDFKYYKGNFHISGNEGIFAIIESD